MNQQPRQEPTRPISVFQEATLDDLILNILREHGENDSIVLFERVLNRYEQSGYDIKVYAGLGKEIREDKASGKLKKFFSKYSTDPNGYSILRSAERL